MHKYQILIIAALLIGCLQTMGCIPRGYPKSITTKLEKAIQAEFQVDQIQVLSQMKGEICIFVNNSKFNKLSKKDMEDAAGSIAKFTIQEIKSDAALLEIEVAFIATVKVKPSVMISNGKGLFYFHVVRLEPKLYKSRSYRTVRPFGLRVPKPRRLCFSPPVFF